MDRGSGAFSVKFWGVRGELPSPGPSYCEYGGNTSCVEIGLPTDEESGTPQRLIFDAGTGLCQLATEAMPSTGHLFLSKTQWGRTQGVSFFQPAFEPSGCFCFYGPVAITGASVRLQLMNQLRLPYSDISLRHLQAQLAFQDLVSGQRLTVSKDSAAVPAAVVEVLQIDTNPVALGYRLSWRGRTVVYATAIAPDLSLFKKTGALNKTLNGTLPREADRSGGGMEALVRFVSGADLLIYGESGAAMQLRQSATRPTLSKIPAGQTLATLLSHVSVRQVVVTQHPPFVGDRQLERQEVLLQRRFGNLLFAREGMQLSLAPAEVLQF